MQSESHTEDQDAERRTGSTEPERAEALDPARLQRERDEYLEHWKRAQADYKNLRRRTLTDIESAVRRSMQALLEDLLLVMDHLELALRSPCNQEESRNLSQGVEMIRSQLERVLEREGVAPVPEGGQLDPRVHEAVATLEDGDREPGEIVETVRRGYLWKDQVLRHAHVVVAASPAGSDAGGRAGEQER